MADSYGDPGGKPDYLDGDAFALETLFVSFEGWVNKSKISVIVVLLHYHLITVGYGVASVLPTLAKHVGNLRLRLCVHVDRQDVFQFIVGSQSLLQFSIFGA